MKIVEGTEYRDTDGRRWFIEKKVSFPKDERYPFLASKPNAISQFDPLGQIPLGIFAWFAEDGEAESGARLTPPMTSRTGYTVVRLNHQGVPIAGEIYSSKAHADAALSCPNFGIGDGIAVSEVRWMQQESA